jgi:Cu(I)-responsive transcriptional regulator
MNIGAISEMSGIPTKTIRYYEEIGLIPPVMRTENGYRHYQNRDLEQLRFVQRARKLGFTLKDVGNLLALWNDKNRASADVKKFALNHITEIDSRIAELNSIRATLTELTASCHGDDRADCPILENLAKVG